MRQYAHTCRRAAPPRILVCMAALVLTLLALAGADAPEKELFVLTSGEEHFGQIVLRNDRALFIKVEDRIVSVAPADVADRIPQRAIGREYERRRARLAHDAPSHCALGAWCRKVELFKEAKELLEAALKLDPQHAGARKELAALAAQDRSKVPWREVDSVFLRLEAVAGDGKSTAPDSESWERIKSFLVNARPPFTVMPEGDRKIPPTWILRVELSAEVVSENRFYEEVVVSRVWRGTAKLAVMDPKTRAVRFVLDPGEVTETLSPNDKGAGIKRAALAKLLQAMRANPGFRYKKAAVPPPAKKAPEDGGPAPG